MGRAHLLCRPGLTSCGRCLRFFLMPQQVIFVALLLFWQSLDESLLQYNPIDIAAPSDVASYKYERLQAILHAANTVMNSTP